MSLSFCLYLCLLAVVFAVGALRFKSRPLAFKGLTILVGLTFLSEVISRVVVAIWKNSSPVYHVYIDVEYACCAWIYAELCRDKPVRAVIQWSIPGFIILSVVNSVFLQPLTRFPSNMLLIACALIVVLSLLIYRQMFLDPVEDNLFRQPVFWLNTGSLFFFTTTFLCWSFFNYFLRQKLDTTMLVNIIYISNIIYYLTLGVALLV